jgi:hypothetical protein
MAVRLSALSASRPPFTAKKIPGTRRLKAIVRLEELGQLKNPMTSSGI